MYRDSLDALQHVLSLAVTKISAKSGHMQNGIEYCVVHVSLERGEEYRIEAYDREAGELYKAAREHSSLLCLN